MGNSSRSGSGFGTRGELARRAFNEIAALRRAQSQAKLDDICCGIFADLGLPHYALARFFGADRAATTKVLAGRFQPEWAARYTVSSYAEASQIAQEMLINPAPYTWMEVLQRRRVTPAQLKIWQEARDFGLCDGLFTPVRWLDGSYAAVVLGGQSPELDDPLLRSMTEVLSAYYASETLRIQRNSCSAAAVLTNRQRECLAWVREGKSSASIAQILGISSQTVDEHIAEACRKLSVRSRVQAAVEACLLGLID